MDSVKALDLEQRSLGLFRYITLVAHAGSIILAIVALNNIDSQVTSVTNTTTNKTTVSGEFPRHDLIVEFKNSDGSVEKTTKTIESLNTLWMQCINDIVVCCSNYDHAHQRLQRAMTDRILHLQTTTR